MRRKQPSYSGAFSEAIQDARTKAKKQEASRDAARLAVWPQVKAALKELTERNAFVDRPECGCPKCHLTRKAFAAMEAADA